MSSDDVNSAKHWEIRCLSFINEPHSYPKMGKKIYSIASRKSAIMSVLLIKYTTCCGKQACFVGGGDDHEAPPFAFLDNAKRCFDCTPFCLLVFRCYSSACTSSNKQALPECSCVSSAWSCWVATFPAPCADRAWLRFFEPHVRALALLAPNIAQAPLALHPAFSFVMVLSDDCGACMRRCLFATLHDNCKYTLSLITSAGVSEPDGHQQGASSARASPTHP